MIESDEEFKKQFNEKCAKKLKANGKLTKKNILLIQLFVSLGMLNKDVLLEVEST